MLSLCLESASVGCFGVSSGKGVQPAPSYAVNSCRGLRGEQVVESRHVDDAEQCDVADSCYTRGWTVIAPTV
jgi:hypothetical protein